MTEYNYCFIAAFFGTWSAIGLLMLFAKIQRAIEDYYRSDYDREQSRPAREKVKK